jgi:hypothetical protein
MRRLLYFWTGMPLASKLQSFALAVILGYAFVANDLNPRNQLVGFKLWQITAPMILLSILLGRILMPVMVRNPARTEKLLGGLGIIILVLWVFSAAQKPRVILTYLGLTGGMWLEASCWFWFMSEIRLREAAFLNEFADSQTEMPLDSDEEADE